MSLLNKILSKLQRYGIFGFLVASLKYPFLYNRRRKYKEMLTKTTLRARFDQIYEDNIWSSKESGSGVGSELDYTAPLRKWLVNHLPSLDIKVFVDSPCGDFNWMKEVLPNLNVTYIGLDIVRSVIDENNENFSANNIQFRYSNICEDKLPDCDLIMVRDCLFHLSNEDIDRFLENLSSVDYKYLFTTTHIVDDAFSNSNITSGDFRLIDLFASPFNFSRSHVKEFVVDYPKGYPFPKEMILIEKKFVPTSLVYGTK